MTWFCEQRSPLGRWVPMTSPNMPTEKTPSGGRIKIRHVKEIDPADEGLPLDVLQRLYTPETAAE